MDMKISIIINADTRTGWLAPFTEIQDRGDGNLTGCRNVDFLIDGVRNKRKVFENCGHELEVILVVDLHEEIPVYVQQELDAMLASGELTKLVIQKFDHLSHRWNDRLYISTLRHATGDYIAHFDGDAALFVRDGFPFVENCLKQLDSGYDFICQQTPLPEHEHGMWWASTRFFLCKRETIDLDEVERCLSNRYRTQHYPAKHCPCFEQIIALIAKQPAMYPRADYENWVLVNWVQYWRGTLKRLNGMCYDGVRFWIFGECGGPCGASDLVGKKMEELTE